MSFVDNELATSTEPELYHAQSLTEILGKGPFQSISLHIGDASLSAALQGIGSGDSAAIVVDPAADVPDLVFAGIKAKSPFSRMVNERGGGNSFYSIHRAVAEKAGVLDGLNAYYMDLWKKAIDNRCSGNVYVIPQRVEKLLREAIPQDGLRNSCDAITCYYPPPRDFHMFPLRALAALTLKQDGVLRIVTEDAGICLDAQHRPWYVNPSVEARGDLSAKDFPVSPYDFVFGKNGRFVIELTNTQGQLTKSFEDLLNSKWKYMLSQFLGG